MQQVLGSEKAKWSLTTPKTTCKQPCLTLHLALGLYSVSPSHPPCRYESHRHTQREISAPTLSRSLRSLTDCPSWLRLTNQSRGGPIPSGATNWRLIWTVVARGLFHQPEDSAQLCRACAVVRHIRIPSSWTTALCITNCSRTAVRADWLGVK